MDTVRRQDDGEWKVLEFRPDPVRSKLDPASDNFCIGRGTYGYANIRRAKAENTTGKPGEAA